ncbi:protein kinase domain-containing protein [Arthroderma uncinatum]|uniref:protein kinase domain-containing protein n=1 Tax=Arthroderma uncinatum TaxID=74035 RepID=UPI00144A7AE7|nr:protein kinase domain-containing protein [Arthroderma uncinatum]KAF3492229.1 protein kinase domain-containing protein [Arthroderma uncinatum]
MVPPAREAPLAVSPPADAKSLILPPAPSPIANLTPPLTPVEEAGCSSAPFAEPKISILGSVQTQVSPLWAAQFDGPSECSLTLEYRRGQDGGLIKYGEGAWSKVYSAISVEHALSLNASPPRTPTRAISSSPRLGPSSGDTTIFAVKVASGRDAHPIICAEADILTYLHRLPGSTAHIVPFHGYIPSLHAIVMTAIPLSFADYIKARSTEAAASFSTRTMFKPVVGTATWLSLASGLVEGLHWLHDVAGVVHGDVKPQNILLRQRIPSINASTANTGNASINDKTVDAYDPLFVDFTSAHCLHANDMVPSSATGLSALSPPFTAPELLSVASLAAPEIVPAPSSDVFSLAVTLLAAATGYVNIYPGADRMQRLAMSRDGHRVLDYIRSGDQGTRVPRKGIVERVISPAVLKEAERRVTAEQWLGTVRGEVAAFAQE